MSRSAECECDRLFMCGHCLANAPPYHYTLDSGARILVGRQSPAFRAKVTKAGPVSRDTLPTWKDR